MKKGKNSKILGYKAYKINYGTVDSKNLKSIYINIQTWVQPKKEITSPSRLVSNLSRQIKHTIFNTIDKNFFNEKFIVDLDLRSSGIQYGKKSFLNLECFLYLNEIQNFRSIFLKSQVKKICDNIILENFNNSDLFQFTLTKKDITNQLI